MSKPDLPITEELDFAYLLELMPSVEEIPEFAWLPELFSIIGHERLLTLCRYAGGETIRIPTVDQVNECIEALQWFYDVSIEKSKDSSDVPTHIVSLFSKIKNLYDAQNS